MNTECRVLVSFGRTDPLHLTEATHDLLGHGPVYLWGPGFSRPKPKWACYDYEIRFPDDDCRFPLLDSLPDFDTVYCGHGATLLEATAAGCHVQALASVKPLLFTRAWTSPHLDHSGKLVPWRYPGVMACMAAEIKARRDKV